MRQPDLLASHVTQSHTQAEIEQLHNLHEIYLGQDEAFTPLRLISRAFVDQQFTRFITKLPMLFEHYQNKASSQLSELQGQITERVNQAYWKQYQLFRETFGLKLNYSIKREKGINEVRLVKRIERRSFKSS